MKKNLTSKTFILVASALALVLIFPRETRGYSFFTKAICNEDNYCVDVLVECENGEIKNITPAIKGIQFPKEWRDPRPDGLINRWC